MESHRINEAVGIIDAAVDNKGFCSVGLVNSKLGLALSMRYKKKQLPTLINWQRWGFGDYVTALEPATNPPIGQNAAREQKKLIYIKPGKSKSYELELSILTDQKQIKKFLAISR